MYFETECEMAVQGHSKVIDFGAYRNFLLVINSNLGPIMHFDKNKRDAASVEIAFKKQPPDLFLCHNLFVEISQQ